MNVMQKSGNFTIFLKSGELISAIYSTKIHCMCQNYNLKVKKCKTLASQKNHWNLHIFESLQVSYSIFLIPAWHQLEATNSCKIVEAKESC
jgi:hypothetical protein